MEFDRVFSQACSKNPKGSPGPATTFAVWTAIDRFPELDGSTVIQDEKRDAKEHLHDMEHHRSKAAYLDSREKLIECIRGIYREYIKRAEQVAARNRA